MQAVNLAIFVTLAVQLACPPPPRTWTGFTRNGKGVKSVGTYALTETCRVDIEKTGGWCGKNCNVHGKGVTTCDPLLQITKKQ